ncbi:hydrogenobyrinic acid a,c-diamide synthase (glutamine-hydrolysing) /cobyrinate a,c-diamide synthase [Azospirillum baldaniorum]|uniref:cobyrinate a,c-diamide synthase n=1 Tax=Azospirillum baldaniorum TaxID=1064539 RepID=UPI0011AC9226|nr:cobyrinate a,c-diamide synthase [Azospirillum baldaniorum]TWA55060.1 hydrogenobyrinic acid a,c-diamide synthase (glutamine-hydrolysing) /cobyrinate a,c-diamide synthase [Azospirillum baldaniorum]
MAEPPMSEAAPRGLIVGAPASGTGKTTVTLGLLVALKARGLRVGAVKAGPDYIDPAFHQAATGRPSVNLDNWAMGPDLLDSLARRAGDGTDLLVCEALMGLFDGVAGVGATGTGATSELAARTGWPVILVINAKGQSQSAAALVKGFATYRDNVRIGGVILNNIASPRHLALAGGAIEALGIPVLGSLPRTPDVILPERHLGLIQAEETADLQERLTALGRFIAQHVDLDRVAALATPSRAPEGSFAPALPPLGQRIAIARDAAFTFVYPHLLEGWRAAGAEVTHFSPLADEAPPADADAVYLPGGYPELHAGRLAAAESFRAGMHRVAALGRPIYGECGGYMVLGESLEDAAGTTHPMLGLLGVQTSFAKRKLHLGYRRAVLLGDTPLGRAGTALRGHEFHYASILDRGADEPLVTATAADGSDLGPLGGRRGSVFASFFHVIAADQ